MNDQNLIPFDQRTEEEQRAIASKGGVASGRARRKKKLLREGAQVVLASKAGCLSDEVEELIVKSGFDPGELTISEAIIFSLVRKAVMDGDVDAIKMLFEMTGEGVRETIAEDKIQLEREQFTARRADVLRARTEHERDQLFNNAPSDSELRELIQAERENLSFLDTMENL